MKKKWDWNTLVINNIFSFQIAVDIIRIDEDPKVETMNECQHRKDWPKWKEYIPKKLYSLEKWEVFEPVVQTPEVVKLIEYKWVFIRKCNEKNEITIYKMWLIAQGFPQKPSINYEETYSPMMDATIFRYLICLTVLEWLDLRFMNVIIAYLRESLDNHTHTHTHTYIYTKILEGFQIPEATNSKYCSIYSIKLQRSLYQLSNLKTCDTITSMNIWSEKYVCITLFIYTYSLYWIFAIIIVYVEHWIFLELLKSLQK